MNSHHYKFHRTGLCCILKNNTLRYNDAIYVHLDGSKNYFRILIPWLRLAYSLGVYMYARVKNLRKLNLYVACRCVLYVLYLFVRMNN